MAKTSRACRLEGARGCLGALALALALVLAHLAAPQAAWAQETGTISVTCADPATGAALVGVEVDAYRVGGVEDGALVLEGPFAGLPVTMPSTTSSSSEWAKAASTLAGYVQAGGQDFSPADSAITDGNGVATLDGPLDRGIYLVLIHSHTQDGTSYAFSPILASVPQDLPDGSEGWQVTLDAKVSTSHTPQGGSLRVVKRWDDGNGAGRPTSITVKVWRDGKLFTTQDLSDANDWSYSWDQGEAGHEWAVTEDLPDGSAYKVTVEQGSDGTFTLTNTRTSQPPTPRSGGGRLPKTGDPWLPLVALLCGGLALMAVGQVAKRRGGSDGQA